MSEIGSESAGSQAVSSPDLERVRELRRTLENADRDGQGVWRLLRERFPPASLIASPDDVRAALDLAYEIGFADGEAVGRDGALVASP